MLPFQLSIFSDSVSFSNSKSVYYWIWTRFSFVRHDLILGWHIGREWKLVPSNLFSQLKSLCYKSVRNKFWFWGQTDTLGFSVIFMALCSTMLCHIKEFLGHILSDWIILLIVLGSLQYIVSPPPFFMRGLKLWKYQNVRGVEKKPRVWETKGG